MEIRNPELVRLGLVIAREYHEGFELKHFRATPTGVVFYGDGDQEVEYTWDAIGFRFYANGSVSFLDGFAEQCHDKFKGSKT